ncbi:MAG TPA: type II toxin-antitoxin system RelE/ParE family toxin [Nitrososphaerales archaeon]|nr:type II toxin-antitoxin system RelE/ParE family toxin [Nitrososphaerales archaeon]
MTLSVLLTPRAAKSIRKLERSVGGRIQKSLAELAQNPESGEQLRPSKFWKTRVGDYRAIYEIDRSNGRVIVLFIGHRKNVYDEFSRLV